MHHTGFVDRRQRAADLATDAQGRGDVDQAFAVESGTEALAGQQLHGDVRRVVIVVVDVVDLDDAGMAQLGGGPRFVEEARHDAPVAAVVGQQQLDRDLALEAYVARAVHRAHTAAADLLDQLIRPHPRPAVRGHGARSSRASRRGADEVMGWMTCTRNPEGARMHNRYCETGHRRYRPKGPASVPRGDERALVAVPSIDSATRPGDSPGRGTRALARRRPAAADRRVAPGSADVSDEPLATSRAGPGPASPSRARGCRASSSSSAGICTRRWRPWAR